MLLRIFYSRNWTNSKRFNGAPFLTKSCPFLPFIIYLQIPVLCVKELHLLRVVLMKRAPIHPPIFAMRGRRLLRLKLHHLLPLLQHSLPLLFLSSCSSLQRWGHEVGRKGIPPAAVWRGGGRVGSTWVIPSHISTADVKITRRLQSCIIFITILSPNLWGESSWRSFFIVYYYTTTFEPKQPLSFPSNHNTSTISTSERCHDEMDKTQLASYVHQMLD